ncbi:MAG: T9SS type A sorting domain-containing protein [Ignavibacteria bacterium]|nr:T9SS type A sorting domain-containing protein [Ignavibacteria bacterium]
MRKLLSTLFLFLTITGISYPQNNWEIVTPKPFQNSIKKMLFIGNHTFVGVAENKTVYRSTDNGNSWTYQKLNFSNQYIHTNIYFIDNNTGWIISQDGKIYKTTNAGLNWFSQISNSNSNLRDIKFINNQIGYIAGSNGTVLKTTDGGETWKFKGFEYGQLIHFYNLELINENTLIVRGKAGPGSVFEIMYKTENSGDTWQLISTGQKVYTSICITNNSNILVLGREQNNSNLVDASIYLSSNSGSNWIRVFYDSLLSPVSLTVLNNEIWLICNKVNNLQSGNGVIYKSTNNGNNWNFVSNINEWIPYYEMGNVINIIKDNSSKLFIFFDHKIYTSNNNGLKWIKTTHDNLDYTYEIKFLNETTGFSKLFAHLLRTTNNGISWDSVNVPKDKLGNVTFADNNTVFYSRFDTLDNFYKSINSGLSFNRINIGNLTPLAVNFNSNILRIIFIEKVNNKNFYGLLKSTDLGNTFEKTYINSNLGNGIKKILFFQNTGYMLTRDLVYKTNDGGLNWSQIYEDQTEANISKSGGLSDNFIWFLKSDLKVFKSSDEGVTWDSTLNIADLNIHPFYYDFNFITKNKIILAAYKTEIDSGYYQPVILNSTDGGINWITQKFNFIFKGMEPSISIINEETGYCIFSNKLLSKNILINIENNTNVSGITDFILHQNYPNPFNPETKIKFSIKNAGQSLVTLNVYDVTGKLISKILNDKFKSGNYEVTFNASNLPSGVYFYKLESNNYSESKKMILIK